MAALRRRSRLPQHNGLQSGFQPRQPRMPGRGHGAQVLRCRAGGAFFPKEGRTRTDALVPPFWQGQVQTDAWQEAASHHAPAAGGLPRAIVWRKYRPSRKATASLDPLSGGVNRWTNCRPGGQAHALHALLSMARPAFPRKKPPDIQSGPIESHSCLAAPRARVDRNTS